MRGFLIGSIGLVALYALVQPNAGNATKQGASWLVSGLRRLVSADIAGVPQRKGQNASTATPATGG